MNSDTKYFGRYYHLTIGNPSSPILDVKTEAGKPAMDIKFDVTYARGQVVREGTISVLGLSMKTMQQILKLSAMARGDALSKAVRVKIDAGYSSAAGWINLLDGYVWTSTITSPPTMWLQMQVSEYHIAGGKSYAGADEVKGQSITKLCKSIAEIYSELEYGNKRQIVFRDKTTDNLCDKEKTCSVKLFGKNLRDALVEMSKSLSDKVVFTLLRDSSEGEGVGVICAYDKDPQKAAKGTILVDEDHGLLSVSGVSVTDATVTQFLTKNQNDLTYLQLVSKLNPQGNDKYIIMQIKHFGHFEGNEWYTQYTCTGRPSLKK